MRRDGRALMRSVAVDVDTRQRLFAFLRQQQHFREALIAVFSGAEQVISVANAAAPSRVQTPPYHSASIISFRG